MRRLFSPLLALALLAAALPAPAQTAKPPSLAAAPVRTDLGSVRGTVAGDTGDLGVFKGIPFAAPPVGDLRWKEPQSPAPWSDVRECTKTGPWCPQPPPLLGLKPDRTSEDCLYLNVWTPARTDHDKLPVMVWIHGGGFASGSGGAPHYDGSSLARQGAVVVTINYRLGPFGFLAHPLLSKESPHEVSGNYGFLDQVAALRWVRKNIAAFGGDPQCVTIFGESAGSAAVARLMVSPLAKGLFHRAIAESGGARGHNRRLREAHDGDESAEAVGERIARDLGCDKADDPLKALRAKSAEELLAAAKPIQGLFGEGTRFGPVVDGWALPDDPDALWAAGKQYDVPFLAGTNANEGTIFLGKVPVRTAEQYRQSAQALFGGHADDVLALFPADTDAAVRKMQDRLITVSAFASPARAMVRAAAKGKSKAWLYQFTHEPPVGRLLGLGAFHAGEIGYVFGNDMLGGGDKDRALARTMSAYWVNFARTGDPNGPGLPAWPAYTIADDKYLELGDTIRAGSGLYKEACDLFDRIHK